MLHARRGCLLRNSCPVMDALPILRRGRVLRGDGHPRLHGRTAPVGPAHGEGSPWIRGPSSGAGPGFADTCLPPASATPTVRPTPRFHRPTGPAHRAQGPTVAPLVRLPRNCCTRTACAPSFSNDASSVQLLACMGGCTPVTRAEELLRGALCSCNTPY
ncbi:hypothetical protein FA95DRAFT_2108 [Auriscalpium vulgare]|uniref:Uncharacterized protein n=1 Tax=Auriscalpium vulgare TaxID=40419 RepID=A0ACB8SBI3_9AGAM|nr:hypothetical protein FA95DRAFT_2108 [Auriscalpium vulgare]